MGIKTKIKNDLWRVNYIVPFVKKHQFDEKSKVSVLKNILQGYISVKPIKGVGKRSVGNDTRALLSKIEITFDENSRFVYFIDTNKTIAAPGNILSNFTIDYRKIIYGSWREYAEAAFGNDKYGQEAALVDEGIRILIDRIKSAIEGTSFSSAEKQKRIRNFTDMLEKPAEHFDEALQRILFFNQIMWQTRHRLNGLGHLDKMLDSIYMNDIESGYMSGEDAGKMIFDFLNQLSKYPDYKSDALEGDIGQIIILGGCESDDSYFYNELTFMFMKVQTKLRKPDPKVLLRVSSKMPDELLECAVKCLLGQTGSPLFSNDDVVIPALQDYGVDSCDTYEYCTSACWEPFIVGKSMDQNNIAVFDYFTALDSALKNEYSCYESLVSAYIKQNKKKFELFLQNLEELKWAKDPLVSILTNSCSEKRIDVSEGGCQYKDYGITTVALSNVVDSLLTVKELVYKEKKYTLSELNIMRKDNFSDNEKVYEMIRDSWKFFGKNNQAAIELTNQITGSMAEVADSYRNRYGGSVKFGLSSPGYNILSKKTSADLSGRKKGMPYNTHISCMSAPYTDVVEFAAELEYNKHRFNGNVVDFFVTPGLIEQNLDKFVLFMRGAIKVGFFQMQMNVMDSKTLIEAKKHPERYPGLIVRVWGFSAYFNELPESYKDLLIECAVAAERAA
ncbi:MAG: hypothetical protein LUH43_04330 [Clostridia bacterium]|nr:hypothetical protein [Clostridia bacterium]